METKICNKCKEEKELNQFYKRSDSTDGYRNDCKACFGENSAKNRKNNIEYYKKYREDNKDILKEKEKIHYQKNKETIKERTNKYYHSNKNKLKIKHKIYREEHKEEHKEYLQKNKSKIKQQIKEYYKNNKEKIKAKRKQNHKLKWQIDPLYKLKISIRNIIYKSLTRNGYKKHSKTEKILGCDFQTFKLYIEAKFEYWMTWENKGLYNGDFKYGWDIDHIIPINSAKTEEDIINLSHYTNLQPLCSKFNRDIKKANT